MKFAGFFKPARAALLARTNAPGFYRFMLGDFEITALSDGTVDLPMDTLLKGVSKEQVDEIYITHMHPDHIGGLLADGKIAFPNAVVRADKRDSDHWLNDEEANKAPTP